MAFWNGNLIASAPLETRGTPSKRIEKLFPDMIRFGVRRSLEDLPTPAPILNCWGCGPICRRRPSVRGPGPKRRIDRGVGVREWKTRYSATHREESHRAGPVPPGK